ncbi:MAG: Energy-coupling factor transporter transmembrane protein EcfT [Firmicutes bacterium]|nr:Energy-coupling factor transporter transmembrane protein EcfT [candidate division NPL-UPA2 bacterium]MBT9155261.1 Energy-coupling factor transporter transmembrane protein EcfT [candidate division NPL-UPA2 bacterium]
MLANVTLGQYFPGASVVHRLDPRTKLGMSFAYIMVLFIATSWLSYSVLGLASLLVIWLSQVPVKMVLRGLRPILMILSLTVVLHVFTSREGVELVSFWFVRIYSGGVTQGFLLAFRLVLLVLSTSVLTLTTSPIALTDAIEVALRPLRRFGVPAHELAMMMTIALRFIPTLLEEAEKIMKAQLARGADFESGGLLKRAKSLLPLLIPLFISAFRRADELAMAMEARCYRGGEGRTKYKVLKYSGLDAYAVASFVVISAVALAL